ncbi:hypothetical protein GGE65_007247 [Skermanella aerolata]
MEIAFKTKGLRAVCLSVTEIDERYGAESGALLRRWLADIRAAECLSDVPLLSLSWIPSNLSGEVVVDVGAGLKVVLKANHQKPPKFANGEIDWSRVDRVLIHRIEQAHD